MARWQLAMIAGAVFVGGSMAGVGLGRFATGGASAAETNRMTIAEQIGNPNAMGGGGFLGDSSGETQPVVCKGCGPGIAQRMSNAYAFGYDDKAVQAYYRTPEWTVADSERAARMRGGSAVDQDGYGPADDGYGDRGVDPEATPTPHLTRPPEAGPNVRTIAAVGYGARGMPTPPVAQDAVVVGAGTDDAGVPN